MFDKKLANKIDYLIQKKFPIIYDYNFDGIVLLYGGTSRNLMMGEQVKDLDFVVLTQGICQIKDFIKKYKLKYTLNAFGGYKIIYNDFTIDMFSTDDLLDAARYNIDMLFYDIQIHQFISCGAIKAIEEEKIVEINNSGKPLYCNIERRKKIIKFMKFVYPNKKKIKIRENKVLWNYKMFLEVLKRPNKIKKIFRR